MPPELAVRAPARGTAVGGPSVAVLVLAAAVFGTGFAEPTLVENVAVGDLAILTVIAAFLARALAGGSLVSDLRHRLALPALLIALGSLLAATHVGLQEWIVGDLARDAGVGIAFVAVVDTARREGTTAQRAGAWALALAACVVSVQLLLDDGIRAAATFPNPNVAGHFLATALLALLVLPVPRGVRLGVVPVVVVGLLRTSSFGALLMVVVGLGYFALSALRSVVPVHRHRVLVLAAVGGLVVAAGLLVAPDLLPEDTSERSGLSTERLDRSASGRVLAWSEGAELVLRHPLGIGPGSTGGLELLSAEQELHNEPLAYLVERGVVGLVGYVALAVGLWRLAPPGGAARALLLAFGLSTLVREPSHYRHLWLVLALVLVHDTTARRGADRGRV